VKSARLVGALTRMTRDLALAEDLAQVPRSSPRCGRGRATASPFNPAAWLMQTAKRRGVDRSGAPTPCAVVRRARPRPGTGGGDARPRRNATTSTTTYGQSLTCHPALSPESGAALTLRLVGGLTVPEIARAFFTKDTTVGQRISRAKKTLEGESIELPVGQEREQRLDDVMGVLYLIFNEGYTATAGDDWARPDLCAEAIRVTRMLAEVAPQVPDVYGLLALMELQASRLHARTDADGSPVLLEDQDRSRWDSLMIRRGLAALDRAMTLSATGRPIGPYVVQAQIAACHARAKTAAETAWGAIADWYDLLAHLGDNPVVQVNRAVAQAGLQPGRGPGGARRRRRPPLAGRLTPGRRGPRRPALPGRTAHRGGRGVRPGRVAHRERSRARRPDRPGSRGSVPRLTSAPDRLRRKRLLRVEISHSRATQG
jgi:predicted RNA polymerase sigma factor